MGMRRLGLYSVCVFLLGSGTAAAQTSAYYLSAGDQRTNVVVQGGTLLNFWTQANGACCGEYAIAVSGDVRTLANGNTQNELGSQYTLGGTYTGTTYPYPVADALFYDGATDGTHNYTVNYGNGDVWQMDRDWANPTLLFSTGLTSELGITWDASNNTLWTLNYGGGTVSNWTLGGSLLSSFNSGLFSAGSLALDYADQSLWMTSQFSFGTLYQFSKTGTALGVSDATLQYNYLGGEFDLAGNTTAVPEPASIVLLASGLLGLAPTIRRRMRRT
jgi:hypothetical protein